VPTSIVAMAVGVAACADDKRAPPCYPAFPRVTPTSAPAGSVVTVASDRWSGYQPANLTVTAP
jgi:hypothetical protein